MTSTPVSTPSVPWLRQLRGGLGIVLMVVSLFGGYCTGTRITEESSEETSEVLEYAHRQESQRSLNRRARALGFRPASAVAVVTATSLGNREERRSGQTDPAGHLLTNGLRAPLRC